MFVIEDEIHAEPQGQYPTKEEAISELRRRAAIPWDGVPNMAPCQSWKTCGRNYEVIEYDDTKEHWIEIQRIPVLEISAAGVKWKVNVVE